MKEGIHPKYEHTTVRCACGARKDLGRPTVPPHRNREAFMAFLKD